MAGPNQTINLMKESRGMWARVHHMEFSGARRSEAIRATFMRRRTDPSSPAPTPLQR